MNIRSRDKFNKIEIHNYLVEHLNDKIGELKKLLETLYLSTSDVAKSSAGDKHETAVSMAQLEQEKIVNQYNSLLHLKEILLRISTSETNDRVKLGSFIETDKGNLYISIGLGTIEMTDLKFNAISNQAPISKLLIGKKVGDEVTFNNQTTKIIQLY
jgi:transcription elongation GreA/GreB family factor